MATPFKLPVPESPPNEGDFLIVQMPVAWVAIVTYALMQLKNKYSWDNPPDDIEAQVDQLIYQMMTSLD